MPPWAVATARLSAVSVLVLALAWARTIPRVSAQLLPLIVAVGAFDAGANALIALARALAHTLNLMFSTSPSCTT